MTSNVSAGPVVVDNAKQQLIFVDMNPKNRFFGIAPLAKTFFNLNVANYTVLFRFNYTIFGFTADLDHMSRKIYWTAPGKNSKPDGHIYYAYIDQQASTFKHYSLTAIIGQEFVIDPMGIAIHQYRKKVYWVDKNISADGTRSYTCLRSCSFDGTGYSQVYLYQRKNNITLSANNVTDLVIDFFHNDTALFVDSHYPATIIASNLNAPNRFNNSNAGDKFQDMEASRVICDTVAIITGKPQYLAVDTQFTTVYWSDPKSFQIAYARYIQLPFDLDPTGVAYSEIIQTLEPVGMAFDHGMYMYMYLMYRYICAYVYTCACVCLPYQIS